MPRPGAEDAAGAERQDRNDEQRPAEPADPAPEQAPGQREDDAGREQELGAMRDRAFQRSSEEQDSGQTSGAADAR